MKGLSYTPERRFDRSASIDLGHDEPINAIAGGQPYDRRRVSTRWLSGIVLTMMSGSALIGAAIYAALDRQASFAEAPSPARPRQKETVAEPAVNPRKADRLVKPVDIVAAKQTFRTDAPTRVGDREVIRKRAFTRVSTSLAVTSAGYADDVPRFNPLRLLADKAYIADAPDPGPMQDQADVAFTTVELISVEAPSGGAALTREEIDAQVQEHVKSAIAAGNRPPIPLPPQMLLMRTSRVGLDPTGGLAYARPDSPISAPFSSIEVRMVPENVTLLPKTLRPAGDRQPTQMEERLVIVRKNETLEDILRAQGATREQIASIVAAFGARRGEAPVREGHRLKLLLADMDGEGSPMQIGRINVYDGDALERTVAIRDSGDYVQVEKVEPAQKARPRPASDDEDDEDSGGMRLYNSVYETALKQEIPRPIIDELIRIFANDVDFQRSVSGGDAVDVFYEENEENENRNELLFASITTRDETFRYYRFQTPDDNVVDFYDENGRSARKFLIRKPISAGEMRSGFGMRYHPILRYSKMHSGVDWSAPIGTPIVAAGSGTVLSAQWDSGYGRRVEIQHPNGYITTYNHMSGFAKGVTEGVRVRQGQVVGYLGSSGLSTGPHLHYEVMVNGHFVDPMRIRLTRTKEFDGRLLGDFRRERERIDSLMAKAPNATKLAARR